jgi:nickel-type superoxide dismutase maturation protease
LLLLPWRRLQPGQVVALPDPRDGQRLLIKRVGAVDAAGIEVLGDNADASTDSRQFGLVERRAILGRVVYRYGPRSRAGWWPQ